MKKIAIFFIFFGFMDVSACQIKFYKKTFYFGERNSIKPSDLIETTTCPEEIQKRAGEMILNSSGPLRAGYLEKAIEPPTITIVPEKIEISSMLPKIKVPENWAWENLKTLDGKNVIHGESISINCPTCSNLGKKAIEIKIDGKTIWANGELKALIPVLISKSALSSTQENLFPEDFEINKVLVSNVGEYFTSQEEIKYYKLNMDLPQGTLLKKSYIRKKDLIRPGTPAILKLINAGISIKGTGIPMSPGKLGEMVKVKNQKTNTYLYGKVVGENTISVDL